jgi:hypothetical protein
LAVAGTRSGTGRTFSSKPNVRGILTQQRTEVMVAAFTPSVAGKTGMRMRRRVRLVGVGAVVVVALQLTVAPPVGANRARALACPDKIIGKIIDVQLRDTVKVNLPTLVQQTCGGNAIQGGQYHWSIAGPAAAHVPSSGTASTFSFTPDVVGNYAITVIVIDQGRTEEAKETIHVDYAKTTVTYKPRSCTAPPLHFKNGSCVLHGRARTSAGAGANTEVLISGTGTGTAVVEDTKTGATHSYVMPGKDGPVFFSAFDTIELINKSTARVTMTESTPSPSAGSTLPTTSGTTGGTPSTPTPTGSSSSIGPLEACVDVLTTGTTTVENVKVLDNGATGLKGTVTFNGQGINLSDPILFSTTGLTAAPFVVSQPGTSTITISVALPSGKTQQLTLDYTLATTTKTSSGCTPQP